MFTQVDKCSSSHFKLGILFLSVLAVSLSPVDLDFYSFHFVPGEIMLLLILLYLSPENMCIFL